MADSTIEYIKDPLDFYERIADICILAETDPQAGIIASCQTLHPFSDDEQDEDRRIAMKAAMTAYISHLLEIG